MHTTHPLIDHPSSRFAALTLVTRSMPETMHAFTEASPGEQNHGRAHAAAREDHGHSARFSAAQTAWLPYLRKELMLMKLQALEVRESSEQMLQRVNVTLDVQRDLLHLSTRMEGVLWQLENVMQVAERLMGRPSLCQYAQDAGTEYDLAASGGTHKNQQSEALRQRPNRKTPRRAPHEDIKSKGTIP